MEHKHTRFIALFVAIVMVVAMLPMGVLAAPAVGDTQTTGTDVPPAAVEGAVWVQTNAVECKKIEHTHEAKCYYYSCDHNDGHLSSCYSETTVYELCGHTGDAPAHTGTATLSDVVTISGTNVSWKTSHPAYPAVYAVYKAAYDDAYASAKYMKEYAAKAAGVAALVGKTFCYTTSPSATPDLCTHTCSEVGGSCYTKICLLEEHKHEEGCFQYTWTLKADINNNGIADDADTYYSVKYVSDGETLHEEAVLVGMPTPTIEAPEKEADAQYTYAFAGWDTPVAQTVTGDVVYTAVYTTAVNQYTVAWVNEDGSALEVDENVDYGTMPTYDGELPTKEGDNTKRYAFAGWTPSVDMVTGDVTYTATYTTQNVYSVRFVIGDEVKVEYVTEGNTVAPYQPTKEHYVLSAWMSDNGSVYDFSTPVTQDMELSANWELAEVIFEVVGSNITHTLSETVLPVGAEYEFEIVPNAGYVVESVTYGGTPIALIHTDGKVCIGGIVGSVEPVVRYEVTAAKAALALHSAEMNVYGDLSAEAIFNAVYDAENSNPATLTANSVTVEYLAYSITLFDKTYDWWVTPGTDVSVESFLDQYGLGSLASYIPTDKLPHVFGSQDIERVRVNFAGDHKYPALAAETTVVMVDQRTPTKVLLNTGVKVTYGATEADILALVFNCVEADTARAIVTNDLGDVVIKMDSLNAGKRKAIVTFGGNDTYAPSVAEVEVIIKRAEGSITMTPAKGKFGTTITVPGMTDANASYIEVAMGLKLGANASADAGAVVYVNFPSLIDVDTIENENVRAVVAKIIDGLNNKMSGTMTIAELNEALDSLLPYIEEIEKAGYSMNLSAEIIDALSDVLTKLSEIEGFDKISIQVTVGKQVAMTDAGAYVVAGIIADPNYTTKLAASYAVVTPDGLRAELDWNIKDENGLITIEALRNGYDLGASVGKVYEGSIAEAEKRLYTVFVGVNKDGELVFTRDQSDLGLGAYAELAFIADMGNTMYYAEPIARAFVVTVDVANVQFIDGNGVINNDRIFAYGADATMNAVAFDRTTDEVLAGTMKYYYAGVQANGEVYGDTVAPTRPGAYTVVALFVSKNQSAVGSAVGALVIKPIEVDCNITDNTVVDDGNGHKVNIDGTFNQEILVILDEQGRLNVIIPGVEYAEDVQVATIDALLSKIENMELPAALKGYRDELMSEIRNVFEDICEKYDITSVALNDELPSEVGAYRFIVIGITDTEHEVVTGKATLTILCAHEYDNACDADCNLCGENREVGDHVYDDEYDKDCNICGEEREVPERPTTPSKPDNDNPQTGDTGMTWLWVVVMVISGAAAVFCLVQYKRIAKHNS